MYRFQFTTKLRSLVVLACGLFTASFGHAADLLIYGATPGGIAAAISAARHGHQVTLVEPTRHVGGLLTSGLSHTDFHSVEGITGTFLDFTRRVQNYYRAKYGPDSPQALGTFHGTFAEPHVNELVLEQMLAEQKVNVLKQRRLVSVETAKGRNDLRQLRRATFTNSDGKKETLAAALFIDATYEGDLMALAGVKFRVGREGRDEYGEPLAPEKADGQLQAYNFRFIATTNAANRLTPQKPAGYHREEFLGILPMLGKEIKRVFGYPSGCIFKAQTPVLPNDKYDINDVSRAPVRLSMPGHNLGWPEGDLKTREQIMAVHLRYEVGLLWFLQNDEAVPAPFRDEARLWGWCKDEFTDNAGLPWQLYVREARRMVGQYVFTERDTDCAPEDARAVLRPDAIAMGEYGPNCHGTSHEGPLFGGKHTGEFYKQVPPYQIPYGVLVPKEVDNLLVPVAISASHVGFCALRLEPIWTSLGQAAGHAAHLALKNKLPVQKVPVPELQDLLHADKSATIYVSDVAPGSPHFTAVQWFGTRGAFHGLSAPVDKCGQRGKNLHGQYYEANPGHAVEPDQPVDQALLNRWINLLPAKTQPLAKDASLRADGKLTRGEALQRLYRLTR